MPATFPKMSSIEELFGKTAIGQLTADDQKRSWSYLDLCLREIREPFVRMLANLRQQKELRDAFVQHLGVTPEQFNERWRERVTVRATPSSPPARATTRPTATSVSRDRVVRIRLLLGSG